MEGKTKTHEFGGRSGARLAYECYRSYENQIISDSGYDIDTLEMWHQDNRLGIDERVKGWERP